MANAAIQQLADLVADQINGSAATFGTWGTNAGMISATRVYRIKRDLSDAPDVTGVPLVQVSIYEETRQLLNRDIASLRSLSVNICVIQKIDPNDNAQCDPLLALSDQFADFFTPIGVAIDDIRYVLAVIEKPALYVPDDLDQEGVFVSVTRLTYQLAM